MLFNIVVGFMIPWLLAYPLIHKQPKLFIVISPATAVVSIIINTVGFFFEYWHFKPIIARNQTISALPFDLGLYAVLGSLMIYSIQKRICNLPPLIIFIGFSLFTTFLEYIALQFDKVTYGDGWNIGWTFISYSLAYLAVIAAWRIAKSHIDLVEK